MEDSITISKGEYEQLVEDSLLLQALRNAGVDNWDGWDFAIDLFEEYMDQHERSKDKE